LAADTALASYNSSSLLITEKHSTPPTCRNRRGESRKVAIIMARGVVAVVGVGPKLGRSVARRFAHEGYTIAILSRDLDKLSRFADEIAREEKAQVFAIRIDCSDAKRVREAFEGIHSLGFVEVLVYNVSAPVSWNPPKFTDIRLESFEKALTVSAVGAFHCAQQVLPGMVERRKGTILFTGSDASVRGSAGFSELTCGKFALRGLSQCLAREFQPQGIHVAHIIIDGTIGTSGSKEPQEGVMDPDAIAQMYWQIHIQDRSAWTQELDIRPFSERF
jgi:short-subunit dehydrogenase